MLLGQSLVTLQSLFTECASILLMLLQELCRFVNFQDCYSFFLTRDINQPVSNYSPLIAFSSQPLFGLYWNTAYELLHNSEFERSFVLIALMHTFRHVYCDIKHKYSVANAEGSQFETQSDVENIHDFLDAVEGKLYCNSVVT